MNYSEAQAKQDIFAVLETCPKEVTGLLQKIEAGEIDGSCYTGECKCLLGTLTELKVGVECFDYNEVLCYARYDSILATIKAAVRKTDACSPAEEWFTCIQPGDTPMTNAHSKCASEWIQEWLDSKGMIK